MNPPTTTPPPASTPRADVQGLRALAVLAVIADHVFHVPGGGFTGVDVFFVISGYLITGLLLREYERTGTISFRRFYVRRVKRIIPVSLLVLWTTATASLLLLGGDRLVGVLKDCVAALLFAANIRFSRTGTDYFQEGLAPSPVQHFWSLAVEEQYYLVWPWVMLAVLALGTRRFAWGARQHRAAVAVLVVVLVAGSFAFAVQLTDRDPTSAYFSTAARAWELGVGAIVAVAGSALAIRSPALRTALGWTGLVGIVVGLFVVPAAPGFPAPWALLPVLSTALVLAAGAGGEQRHLWPLTSRPSRYLGDISYSLYLWHWPVTVLAVTVVSTSGWFDEVGVLAVTLVLSVASYHLVEDPVRRSGWLTSRTPGSTHSVGATAAVAPAPPSPGPRRGVRHRVLVVAVAAVVVLALPGGLAAAAVLRPEAASLQAAPTQDGRAAGPVAPACFGAAALVEADACADDALGDLLRPSPDHLSEDTAHAYDCYANAGAVLRSCTLGPRDPGTTRIALVGDSHAAALLPGLQAQLAARGWQLDVYTGNGCQWRERTSPGCASSMESIREQLRTGGYAAVLTTASRAKAGADVQRAAADHAAAWAPVLATGTQVVVIADVPRVSADAMACLTRVGFSVQDEDCPTPRATALADPDPLVLAARTVPGVAVVDLTDEVYCTADACPAVIGHALVYRDTASHLTGTYSATVGPYLAAEIASALARAQPSSTPTAS